MCGRLAGSTSMRSASWGVSTSPCRSTCRWGWATTTTIYRIQRIRAVSRPAITSKLPQRWFVEPAGAGDPTAQQSDVGAGAGRRAPARDFTLAGGATFASLCQRLVPARVLARRLGRFRRQVVRCRTARQPLAAGCRRGAGRGGASRLRGSALWAATPTSARTCR